VNEAQLHRERAEFEALSHHGFTGSRWIARTFEYRQNTGSTNDDARLAARNGAAHGHTILADAQSAGRGRRGRSWHSPEGTNLYLSVLLRPSLDVSDAPLLALLSGLAVARACDRFVASDRVTVKWPNDVRIDRKKVAGILVEGTIHGDRFDTAIVGIGLNVHEREWPEELRDKATCLASHADAPLSRTAVLAAVLEELERAVDAMLLGGSSRDELVSALRSRCDTLGTEVTIDSVHGRAIDIANDGALIVERDDHTTIAVRAGEVSAPDTTAR
jgi:BirA family biotin operon repressor/biotin-[acetyl-CoA-carboxylase] ligase